MTTCVEDEFDKPVLLLGLGVDKEAKSAGLGLSLILRSCLILPKSIFKFSFEGLDWFLVGLDLLFLAIFFASLSESEVCRLLLSTLLLTVIVISLVVAGSVVVMISVTGSLIVSSSSFSDELSTLVAGRVIVGVSGTRSVLAGVKGNLDTMSDQLLLLTVVVAG